MSVFPFHRTATHSFAEPLHYFATHLMWRVGAANDKNGGIYAIHADEHKPLPELGGASYRDLLIAFGQAGRAVYPAIWAEVMRQWLKQYKHCDFAIDDLRFPNEYKMLREEGARIVRITNPDREIVATETEALLEGCRFDAELVNPKQDVETYAKQIGTLLKDLYGGDA